MTGLGPHAAFILTAYLAAAGIIVVLIFWVILDGRILRRRIAALEAAGIRRRSAPPKANP